MCSRKASNHSAHGPSNHSTHGPSNHLAHGPIHHSTNPSDANRWRSGDSSSSQKGAKKAKPNPPVASTIDPSTSSDTPVFVSQPALSPK